MRNATRTRPQQSFDLMSLLAEPDEPDVLHALMPNMALACHRDLLWMYEVGAIRKARMVTLKMAETTCTDCLEAADGDLRGLYLRMMGKQAPVEVESGD